MRLLGSTVLLLLALAPTLRADEAPPASAPPTWAETLELARAGDLLRAIVGARAALTADAGNVTAARLLQDLLRAAGKPDTVASDATPPLLRRALAARTRKDAKRAVTELSAVLKSEAAPAVLRLDLARALLTWGKSSQAEHEVERYLKVHPDDTEALTLLGRVLFARKKHKTASEVLERALAGNPGLAGPATALARVHAAVGRPAEARAVRQRALAAYPRNPALLAELAEDHVRTGELDPALRVLTGLLELPVEKSAVHTRLAEVHRMRLRYPEAERCAQAALAIDAGSARALRVLGFLKQKKKDLDGALADYEKAAKLAPAWAQIHADLGFVHMLRGKTIFAERALRKALELDEDLLEARRTLGIVMFQRGKGKLAKRELAVVLKENDDDILANRYLGYVLLDEGKAKAALKQFSKVAELAPKDADSLRMMGNAYKQMGKLEKAIEAYQEAIARDGKFGFAYFDMGKAMQKQERWADAAAAYRKAIELDPTLCHPHLYLAELCDELLDEPEDALKHYKRYLELDGHGEGGWIKKRIEQLERDLKEKK